MKIIFSFFIFFNMALAQDPVTYLKNFDSKVYSLKSKGVKDFVVDIESNRLTKQVNAQQTFGKVQELLFRVYWTQNPERLAVEVMGLPEGFKEVKNELKSGIIQFMDNLIPQTFPQRFSGYKFSSPRLREFVASDTTGIAPIPSFILKFNDQDRLIEIIGNKPVGELSIIPIFEKTSFSDGKWVLVKQRTMTNENGQFLTITKEIEYEKVQGIAAVSRVNYTTEHKSGVEAKPTRQSDDLIFKNYKINEGEALKYFLADTKVPAQVPGRVDSKPE